MARKILEFIGGIITVLLFDAFILWALFLAPTSLSF